MSLRHRLDRLEVQRGGGSRLIFSGLDEATFDLAVRAADTPQPWASEMVEAVHRLKEVDGLTPEDFRDPSLVILDPVDVRL